MLISFMGNYNFEGENMKIEIIEILILMLLITAFFQGSTTTADDIENTFILDDHSTFDINLCYPCGISSDKTIFNQIADEYGTGFLPYEMDLPHLTGHNLPERYVAQTTPSDFDWRTLGKVTSVKNQGACGACYAFAALGCFESKIKIHGGLTYDLSEDNVKECEAHHSCCTGGNFIKVASFLSQGGTVLESCDPYQPFHNTNPPCGSCPLQQVLLDWRIISSNNVPNTDVLKNYIYNEGPIYAAIWSGSDPYDAVWRNTFVNYDGTFTLYKPWTGDTDHAVMIIGWDDSLTHSGGTGGWICKNSWGTNWGGTCGYGTEKGYFTIAYGSAAIGKYSSYIDQWGNYDSNGGVAYYDEGGWTYNWGYSSKTAWGLCKYLPITSIKATRVEFWTNDVTTDVDVYIYGDFNGQSLSNLIWSSENHAFDEAGYHGVAISPPLQLTAFDDLYAVVKFTTESYQYPIVSDSMSPILTGYTYTSPDGSSGSWYDGGTHSTTPTDVAIRLRASNENPPGNPTISGTTSGSSGTSYDYDFISTDVENDKVSFYIDWGDETITDWTPFQSSGSIYSESHTWDEQGTYTIEAKARDIYGVESGWTTLEVTMPVNKPVYNYPFLQWLLERFPDSFHMIQILLEL